MKYELSCNAVGPTSFMVEAVRYLVSLGISFRLVAAEYPRALPA